MTTTTDLIEDWIQIRSTFQRQIQMLESDKMQTASSIQDATTKETIIRLKAWIIDLNKLLKEYSRI
jgi:hypothetical protein